MGALETSSAVFFDLDGTLVDPRRGLIDSFVRGLAAVGVTVDDPTSLEVLVGPPIRYGLSIYLGLTEPSLSVAIEAFREHLGTTGVLEYEVHAGIPELLGALRDAGRRLAVVTSKSEPFAELVLDHVQLRDRIDLLSADSLTASGAEKDVLVERALRILGPGVEATMVGDREFDVLGARAHGMRAIGVTWGFGSRSELESAGADHVVDTVDELRELLLSPS